MIHRSVLSVIVMTIATTLLFAISRDALAQNAETVALITSAIAIGHTATIAMATVDGESACRESPWPPATRTAIPVHFH